MTALNIEVRRRPSLSPASVRRPDGVRRVRHQVLNAGSGKARQWIMNKLLSIFADSLKQQVRNRRCPCPSPPLAQRAASVLQVLEEMRSQIAQQIPVLKSQVRSRKPPHAVSAG